MKTATFQIKVFKKGNYIYVVPTDSETEIEGFAKDVKIARKSITSSDWAFYGFNSDVEIRDYEFPISLIKKENGDAYTNEEFKTWKDENTGFNGGGTAPNDVWQAQVYDNRTSVIYGNKLYILASTVTLPFNSTDFATELVSGSWVEVIPDASETVAGKVSTGTQTLNGNKVIKGDSSTIGNALEIKNSANTEIARFQNNGNVGIGTTTPQNQLHITGSNNSSWQAISSGVGLQSNNNGSGLITAINMTPTDPTTGISSGASFGFNSSSNNFYGMGLGALRNSKYDMWFQTGLANGGGYRWYINGTTERMTLDYLGKLGIGTTIPLGILDVQSTSKISLPYPRMTEAQRLAIVSPTQGGGVYQIDAGSGGEGLYIYKLSTGWTKIG